MKNTPFLFALCLTIVVLIALPFAGHAQERRYFPEVGREAVHQRSLDLSSGAVVLMVALQPGYEDFPLLAHLRMGLGVKTYVLYWTNGEATANDADGSSPGLLAAARREEAFHAATLLGAQPYYLNLPDQGVAGARQDLSSSWNRDSVLSKLVPALRSFAPDVVVVGGDFRGGSVQSVRQQALTELVLAAVKQAGGGKADSLHSGPWHVNRVMVQMANDAGKKEAGYDQAHPLWKVSYREIGRQAASRYKTLSMQLPSWLRRGDRHYSQVYPAAAPAPKQLTAGIPVITQRFKPLVSVVRNAAGKETKGVRSTSLEAVGRAIDTLNPIIARMGPTLLPGELRIASLWKNCLEDLRCSLLDVSFARESSDSLVTQSQIFYLRFQGFSSRTSKTHTQIMFPGVMQKLWGVNESSKYEYDLTTPEEFRVISPAKLDYNYPGAQFGITRPFARTRFSYLISHRDSLPGKNFFYRGEILLQTAPRRTFELLTPAIRAIDGEPVVYRLQNISRDGFEGSMSLQDSILNTASKKILLMAKDEVLVDTLFLSFKRPPAPGSSTVTLELSGMGGSIPVVIRRFDAEVDSSAKVVFLSDIDDSPLTQAMRRLRLPFKRVTKIQPDDLGAANVLVIDRDALATRRFESAENQSLHAWVERGGHLVVFPQGSSSDGGSILVPWAAYEHGPLSAASDSVVVSPGSELLAKPNALTQADWSNWVVARSLWSLRVPPDHNSEVVVKSATTQAPLLLSRKEGRGRVTLVALDLSSQLVNLHPGVHRLLGNLLSRSHE